MPAPDRPQPDRSHDLSQPLDRLHPNESIKAKSDALRGTVRSSLADPLSGGLQGDDHQLTKFHGIYLQDDRDLRDERRRQKLEPAYQFMVRVRLPAGICQPAQWTKLDALATTLGNGTLRLTTRQTFQFHGILKRNLKATVQGLHEVLLDTLGACGDDNRGVLATPLPEYDAVHCRVAGLAKEVSDRLIPRSRAYHEIWLDEEPVYRGRKQGGDGQEEPIYGATYLPRKFKIGFAIPPTNDVDVFTQDLGFIAITEEQRLLGFNVLIGGGMGRTDNEHKTYPRLGDVIGFCAPDRAADLAEAVVTVQRDYGNRADREVARLKYTIDRLGLDWFVDELHDRLGWQLEPAREFHFETSQDRFGWSQNRDGTWNYTLFVENGRVKDSADHTMMSGLRDVAAHHQGDLRITPNQNLIVARIPGDARTDIEALLASHGILAASERSHVRRHSMACVALPTCPLAMAESERYFPELVSKVEALMAEAGLGDVPIVMRMSGCNNGCSRPYVAEVGFSGRAPGKYNMYLGGGFHGQRLNKPYLENVDETTILETLKPMLERYAADAEVDERFGDFLVRTGRVAEVRTGREFNG